MLGLRDLVLIAPNPSLHQQNQPFSTDHHPNLGLPSSAALSVGLGIFPLLTATPCVQQQQPQSNAVGDCGNSNSANYWNLKISRDMSSAKQGMVDVEDDSGKQFVTAEGNDINLSDLRVCKDCGNRAKKDCKYERCRTCCKSRGYNCNTHVKSTWVPAARRRERQTLIVTNGSAAAAAAASSGSSSGAKRPRMLIPSQNAPTISNTSNSNGNNTRSLETSYYHQDANFKQRLPGQVRAAAAFKCHRVSAVGDSDDELAYMATVHISGHVFKGFLYDHGVDKRSSVPCMSQLNLEGNISGKSKLSSPTVAPCNAYAVSGS